MYNTNMYIWKTQWSIKLDLDTSDHFSDYLLASRNLTEDWRWILIMLICYYFLCLKTLTKVFEYSCFECCKFLLICRGCESLHPLKKVCLRRLNMNGLMRKSWGATADLEDDLSFRVRNGNRVNQTSLESDLSPVDSFKLAVLVAQSWFSLMSWFLSWCLSWFLSWFSLVFWFLPWFSSMSWFLLIMSEDLSTSGIGDSDGRQVSELASKEMTWPMLFADSTLELSVWGRRPPLSTHWSFFFSFSSLYSCGQISLSPCKIETWSTG